MHNTFIAFARLVTMKSCFKQNVAIKLKMNIISVLHMGIKQSLNYVDEGLVEYFEYVACKENLLYPQNN